MSNTRLNSQTKSVLGALRHGPITPIEALDRFGCFRLAARIKNLRDAGYDIETERVTENDKTYARYHLVGEPPKQGVLFLG